MLRRPADSIAVGLLAMVLLASQTAFAEEPSQKKDRANTRTVARDPAPPSGFVRMFVAGVLTTEGGPAVVLKDQKEERFLPIWIGFAEAHAIQLRLEKRRFPRPLTHDLLEHIMTELGGELVKIHVDGLEGTTFVGTVYVNDGDQVTNFDARPSDSIALALGSKVPIFVRESVLDRVDAEKKAKGDDEGKKAKERPEGVKTL